MNQHSKLSGLRIIELPVQFAGQDMPMTNDTLSVLFQSLSPKRNQAMVEKYQALEAEAKEKGTPLIDQTAFLLNEIVVSLTFTSDGKALKTGEDFQFDEVDERLQTDIWAGIQDYSYPKRTP